MKKKLMKRMAALAVAALCASAFAGPVLADDVEWDSTWGYHEEEWYDPSDWFGDEPGVDYEDDYYSGSYGNTYDYDFDEYGYGDEYTYDEPGLDDDSSLYGSGNFDYGYDYYTSDWYVADPAFDYWWSE